MCFYHFGDTMVRVRVAGKNCVIPCYTWAVSGFSLLPCVADV